MTHIIINNNITTDSYVVQANTCLIIRNGFTLNASQFVCADHVTVELEGGILSIGEGSASSNFVLKGFGTIQVSNELVCGEYARFYAENISIELSSGKITFGAKSNLNLANYPVIGGELRSVANANNKIFAPAQFIFQGTSLTGGWNCNVAYPEWFVEDDTTNWAAPINRAFQISGEVHLQSRTYCVGETINVPPVGKLIGSGCGNHMNKANSLGNATIEDKMFSTIIVPDSKGYNNNIAFAGNYIIIVNIKKATMQNSPEPRLDFPPVGAKIANLIIDNRPTASNNAFGSENGSRTIKPFNGICIAYTAELENISFFYLKNSIKWTDHYADLKKVTRCNIGSDYQSITNEDYTVDFGFLGDALIFEGNGIHNENLKHKGIRVSTCNSGIITSNIINADVHISNAKGITFSNNHMENGAQIVIDQSSVTLAENFIMKGARPSVVIKSSIWGDNSVVSLHHNQYLYYSYNFNLIDPNNDSDDTNNTPQKPTNAEIEKVCNFDIGIASEKYVHSDNSVEYGKCQCILSICNELRYWVTDKLIGKSYTSGIIMGISRDGGATYEGIDSFNLQSQILSLSSVVRFMDDCVYSYPPFIIKDWKSPHIYYAGLNNNSEWFANETGTFTYYYQIIWSYQKKWISGLPLTSFATVVVPDKSKGAGFGVAGAEKCGNCVLARIIRCKMGAGNSITDVKFADVPIVNSLWIIDNGLTMGGYKWMNAANLSDATFSGTVPPNESFTLLGDTVLPG